MKKKNNRGWGNMTAKQRKIEMARRRAVADAKKNPCPQSENPNWLQAGQEATKASEYSAQQHVYDLENKNRNLRNFAIEVIAAVSEIALRQIR